MLGIGLPVGGHVQHAADLQLAPHQFGEFRLDDPPLVVALLVPGIGEEQQQPIEAGVGHAVAQHFQRVAAIHPHVAQALGQQAVEQRADARLVHLDADEVDVRRGGGHFQGGMAHAETDLESPRCLATEDRVEVLNLIAQFQAELRPAQVEATLLAFGHAPGAHHEALHGAHRPCFVVFRQGVLGRGLRGIAHGKENLARDRRAGCLPDASRIRRTARPR